MAFLNSLVGAFHNITVSAPADDLWAWFILDVFDFIVNYGWRVVLFTLILKLLLSPVDIMQKISMQQRAKQIMFYDYLNHTKEKFHILFTMT